MSGSPPSACVVGGGAWGSALADHLARRAGHAVAQFARNPAVRAALRETRAIPTLPGFPLHEAVRHPDTLAGAVEACAVCVVAVPSRALPALGAELAPRLPANAIVVSASKGIHPVTHQRATEILAWALASATQDSPDRIAALSGPSFARGLIAGDPTAVVTAAAEPALAARVQQFVTAGNLRAYASTDLIGVELGGAVKNVLAIAAGIVDGLGLGPNSRAALITRGVKELSGLVTAAGGKFETAMGLSGLGDLVLTATGDDSRNRAVGRRLGAGEPLPEILASLREVAEGVETARAVVALADRLGVELPICRAVRAALHEGKAPAAAIRELLARPLKAE